MVPDIDAASKAFTRLGFPLTPYSVHGDRNPETGRIIPQGSANRLAMLERGYIEILTAVEGAATAVAQHLRNSMARYVGVHLIAFAVAGNSTEPRSWLTSQSSVVWFGSVSRETSLSFSQSHVTVWNMTQHSRAKTGKPRNPSNGISK